MIRSTGHIFIVIAYLLMVVQPVLPFLHYRLNQTFYSQVLCENKARPNLKCEGKCALRKELLAQNHTNPNPESAPSATYSETEPHIAETFSAEAFPSDHKKKYHQGIIPGESPGHTEISLPPPRS